MGRVAHFELPAADVKRAVKFYEDVFGWRIEKWSGSDYWLIMTGEDPEPGIDGAIMPRTEADNVVRNIIDVESLDESLAKVEAAGGTVVDPKMPVPGVGWLAYFADSEGNVSGLMESDPAAE